MAVRTGILLVGAQPVGAGVNNSLRGFAYLSDGAQEAVFAKYLSDIEIVGEIFCSLLCRAAGLPSPEPVVLRCQQSNRLMFGSIDLPYPNCSQFLNLDPNDPDAIVRLAALLDSWPDFCAVVAFDEWINNRDRNPGNILWADIRTFYLIDHGKSLQLDPHYPDRNKLVDYWLHVHRADVRRVATTLAAAINSTAGFAGIQLAAVSNELPGGGNNANVVTFEQFVAMRLGNIDNFIRMRFPNAQLRLVP